MNAYRIVLILCRVVSLDLWWGAAVSVVSSGLLALIGWFGWLSSPGTSVPNPFYYSLGATVLSVMIAVFVGQFAPAIATAAVGRGSLEGEAIAARTALEPDERALASTGAGLTLLFLGLVGALISTVWSGYAIFFEHTTTIGPARSVIVYSAVSSLLPSFLHCALGFVLAFRSGLRRMVKPAIAREVG